MEDETREEGVEQLLEKLQDVSFVASVKDRVSPICVRYMITNLTNQALIKVFQQSTCT